MQKIAFLALVLLSTRLVFATENCPSAQPIELRDVRGLENFVQNTPLHSIECFIASLPLDIRGFRTYVKSSLSLQEASVINPRAIIGDPRGGFFMSFNGHKEQRGYDEVEFLAVDNQDNPTRWIAGVVKNKNGLMKLETDVSRCTSCHGNPVRPIWGKYPEWPNAFGSVDDWMPDEKNPGKDSKFYAQDKLPSSNGDPYPRLTEEAIQDAIKESQLFREFRKKAAAHPRYALLEEASDPSNPVYPYTEVYRNRNDAFRPNLMMGTMMTLRHNQILFNTVNKSSFFKSYKNALLYGYFCIDEEKLTDFDKKISHFIQLASQNITSKSFIQDDLSFHIFSLFDLKPHQRTLHFADDTNYLDKENFFYFSGYFYIKAALFELLMIENMNSWPDKEKFVFSAQDSSFLDYLYENIGELQKENYPPSYFQSVFLDKEFHAFLILEQPGFIAHPRGNEDQIKTHKIMCDRLAESAQIELASSISPQSSRVLDSQQDSSSTPWPASLNSCIECHDSPNRVASAIPFSSPEKLAEFNKSYKSIYGFGDLFTATGLITRPDHSAAHQNDLRMPLGRAPLTQNERSEILQWIKKSSTAIQ